ncbi:hypothetical protein KUCAC02_027310 [Chaenocephalus aceratus]|uniref:Uncharacterized protein n=1 Tax=Chaenocephalus aceratus TaxID=36190 RepID=A0ACB9W3E2_CHAAC|nr:hypothetical protein KUCAC02_027310 [Chaenocephalus aceratus]
MLHVRKTYELFAASFLSFKRFINVTTDSISSMLALLQQLSGWFHSDATQNPLIVFFVISSCFLCKSETPSLTSTPTHLQLLNLSSISSVALRPDCRQQQFCSDMAMTPL